MKSVLRVQVNLYEFLFAFADQAELALTSISFKATRRFERYIASEYEYANRNISGELVRSLQIGRRRHGSTTLIDIGWVTPLFNNSRLRRNTQRAFNMELVKSELERQIVKSINGSLVIIGVRESAKETKKRFGIKATISY